jgi:SAM-dependent methyltransferase
MNTEHLELCGSDRWAERLHTQLMPWALDGMPETPRLLEIGPGPGAATDVLRRRNGALTTVEFDQDLASALGRRFTDVTVVRGDAAALPFASGVFDGVVAFTMLHHLPSAAVQDRAFAEFARVLRPGGVLRGTDSLDSPGLRRLHAGDFLVPLDPLTLGDRLRAAGFVDVEVSVLALGVRFRARG